MNKDATYDTKHAYGYRIEATFNTILTTVEVDNQKNILDYIKKSFKLLDKGNSITIIKCKNNPRIK